MLFRSPPALSRPGRPGATSSPRCARLIRITGLLVFFFLAALSFTQILSIFISFTQLAWKSDIQNLLTTWPLTSGLGTYPTAFTRDIQPRPIHSHNDYWRKIPVYTAIAAGCISIEADVWEFGGIELFVGHDTSSLSRNRTFRSLYVDPIVKILKGQNPDTEFTRERPEGRINGVYDVDPEQTLHLFIDFKTPGLTTLPVVLAQLEALRTPVNYLTYFNGSVVVRGAVTVHFTGDAPFEKMQENKTYRDYFYDAPLNGLGSGKYDKYNSLIASAPFGREVGKVIWGREVSKEQREKVRKQLKEAHDRGIMARYWDTPGWPISVRNNVWGVLVEEGVDLLNADDVKAASSLDW